MNISAVSFGRKIAKNNYDFNRPQNYNYSQDEVCFNNKTKQEKPKKKPNKVLLGLLAVIMAKNMLTPMPVTTNPNEASNKDLKTLYSFGEMVDFLDGPSSLDFVIEDTEQGKVADCWLLSTVNSLNNTEVGKDLIKNMFEYKDDEYVVHLHSGDYTITDDEMKIGKVRHSKGDDDMLLIELAVEKALAEYNNGNLSLPEAVITPQLGGDGTFSTLNLGSQDAAVYILLGGTATYSQIKDNDEEVNSVLAEFASRGHKDFLLTASIESGDKTAINSEGEEIELKGHHAYSVLDVNDKYITVVNPEDSSNPYCITLDSFKAAFNTITYFDLADMA